MAKNFTPNVILGEQPTDYIAGVNIDTPVVVNESGDWINYPAEHELQNVYGETSACIVFACNDSREPLMMYYAHNNLIPAKHNKWLKDNGYYKNGFINFDDRVPAMFADINVGVGTYLYKGADACRKWSVPEGILPKPKSIAEYYDQKRLTVEAIQLNNEFNKRFTWIWFWVNSLNEGLKYSPVVGTVPFANGSSILCPNGTHNHAVVSLQNNKDYVLIDDSYIQQFKKYCHREFKNYLCWKLIIKDEPMINKSDFLKKHDRYIVRNGDTGGFGIVTGGQLFKLTEERASLCLIDMYNRGELKDKPKSVTLSNNDWELVWSGRYF